MNRAQPSPNPPAHILLIDDNRLGLAARKAVLEELGYRISTAGSGAEGLKRFAETDYALVITDYRMPRMNGLEVIRRIREQAPEVPIILLSGFADTLGLDASNTGADVVIQKSATEVTQMVRAVRKLLRAKKPARKPPRSHSPAQRAKRKAR